MTKIELELHDNLISVINKIKNINDRGVELIIPEGSVLFENILNLKLLEKWAEEQDFSIHFLTDDPYGSELLKIMHEPQAALDFNSNEEEKATIEEVTEKPKKKRKKMKIKFSIGKKAPIIVAAVLIILGIGGFIAYKVISELPQADVKVVVNSQPLTRSFEMQIDATASNDSANKTVKGSIIRESVEKTATNETTGEKLVGEVAEGEVTIFNKTDSEKEFDEGTVLIYEDDDDNKYEYVLKEDVTVPAREEQEPDPENPEELVYIKGSADVEVEAREFGEDYNIDAGEALEIEDRKTSEFEAEVKEDIEGGTEETIKIVAEEDITAIKEKLAEQGNEDALRALDKKVSSKQKLVDGSTSISVTNEELSHELEEETEEIELKQTFTAQGLVYEIQDLDKVIDEIVEDFIPEGYVLSTQERVVNVEILGNSDSTVLTSNKADIQVTLKTFVVPEISEQNIERELMGMSIDDAQRYLGSLRNIKTYELELNPRIPFFDNIPKDENRINVTLERD